METILKTRCSDISNTQKASRMDLKSIMFKQQQKNPAKILTQ